MKPTPGKRGGARIGAGRPLKDGVRKVPYMLYLPIPLRDRLRALSREVEQPIATLVVDLLKKGFRYIEYVAARQRGEDPEL